MYAIKQIKICEEYRDMLPRPRLDLSGTPGLRPIGLSPGSLDLSGTPGLRPIGLSPGSWQTSLGLGSMSRYSAQILICIVKIVPKFEQGKSEGFESCDRPIVRKRPIWVKIGDVFSCVTLKFDGWPWKTIGHLSFAVSSFVQHFIAIGEFKLELLSGNAHFGSNSTIFRAVWPWKTIGHLYYATSSSMHHFVAIGEFKLELQSGNAQFGSKSMIFWAVWPWNLTYDLEKQ